nr:hypothetical protein [Akkermansiaceae bacterium]
MLKPPGFKTGLPVIVLAASLANTQAQTTWTGAIDHDWHNAGNWSNGLPAVGNMPAIGKAGAVVNLTQNVTVSGGTIFNVRSIDSTTGTEPATLDISANLDLSGNAFEVGSRYTSGNPNPAFYQGVVNQTAGEVKASYLKLALRGGIVSAPPSEYHLSGGKLTLTSNLIVTEGANTTTAKSVFHQTGGDVTVGGDFRQGGYQGSGTYLMESVTIDSLRGDNSSSTSLPGALWTTFTGDDVNGVKVELNSESLRGTL